MIQRTLTPQLGKPATLDEGLQTLAVGCLGYLAAYLASERDNALLWAGAMYGLGGFLHELTYEERAR